MDDKETILIVDDDESTCRSLSLLFGRKGYETEMAGTGRETLENWHVFAFAETRQAREARPIHDCP